MTMGQIDMKRHLFSLIQNEALDNDVLDLLLPDDRPLSFEDSMWDYKSSLPTLFEAYDADSKPSEFEFIIARLLRTMVAFHNSYGGYLVIGVDDVTRTILEFDHTLNVDTWRQKLAGATRRNIPITYSVLRRPLRSGEEVKLGLLLVPRRSDSDDPVQFRSDGPSSDRGKISYKRGQIYFRKQHEVQCQSNMEDMKFLLIPNRRRYDPPASAFKSSILDHNVIFSDKTITRIFPRDDYIETLWGWLTDRFNAIKLLCGPGGVGKTTVAGIFAREVLRESPMGFERVIWLSAKEEYFRPLDGGRIAANAADEGERPRFNDLHSLLCALLQELGYLSEEVAGDVSVEDLMEEVISALKLTPSFVVVDDVDTLLAEEQYEVFQTLSIVFNRTLGEGGVSSRALLTARVNLGTATGQRIEVGGFPIEPFIDYVDNLCKEVGLRFNPRKQQGIMTRFHKVSSGSPLFAAAIVSLVSNHVCSNVPQAVERFKERDGEDVRSFAYEREISSLTDSELVLLYIIIALGETSLPELRSVSRYGAKALSDDMTKLQQHHLVAFATGAPGDDETYAAPQSLRLMRDVIRNKIRNPARIDQACKDARSDERTYGIDAGRVISRVVAYWKENDAQLALENAKWGDEKAGQKHPDIKCILGRAYLRLDEQDPAAADAAFRAACELGCSRDELFPLWIEAKLLLKDWKGVIDITQRSDKAAGVILAENIHDRAKARRELGVTLAGFGNTTEAIEQMRLAIDEINDGFREGRARGRVQELQDIRSALYVDYVRLLDRIIPADEAFEAWNLCLEAFENHCRRSFLIRTGLKALERWWRHVERERPHAHESTADLMRKLISSVEDTHSQLIEVGWKDIQLVHDIESAGNDLSSRWKVYVNRAVDS